MMNDEGIKDGLNSVISGMFAGIEKENIEKSRETFTPEEIDIAGKCVNTFDVDGFYYDFIYPLSRSIDGLLCQITVSKKSAFLLKHSGYIENHFVKIIVKNEGSACSADKSRTILRRILKFFETGEEIKFNFDGEYTYHLPKKVFKTHNEIIEFFDAVNSLYYGNFTKYLECLAKIHKVESLDNEKLKSMRHDAGEYGHLTRYQEGQNDLIDLILKGELL